MVDIDDVGMGGNLVVWVTVWFNRTTLKVFSGAACAFLFGPPGHYRAPVPADIGIVQSTIEVHQCREAAAA